MERVSAVDFSFTAEHTPEARSLISQLLVLKPSERLGAAPQAAWPHGQQAAQGACRHRRRTGARSSAGPSSTPLLCRQAPGCVLCSSSISLSTR